MRRCLAVTALAALLAPSAAEARVVPIPALFSAVLPRVKRVARVPVRLPARADLDISRSQLYATGGGRRGRYDLELASTSRCGGANACFLAAFTARRGDLLGDRPNVRLARGIRGHHRPLSCGASCSPPSIAWVQGGVRYELQVRVAAAKRQERPAMIGLANSAIRGGPR